MLIFISVQKCTIELKYREIKLIINSKAFVL